MRDLLLGRPRADVDLVVEGDAAALAARLGGAGAEHERFGTVKVELDGHELDIATARSETYPHPGALPVVAPARSVEADLDRRDFTVNAMALPLRRRAAAGRPPRRRARSRARARCESSTRGPSRTTRPGRSAPPATRRATASRSSRRPSRLLRAADLATVSADRRRAELGGWPAKRPAPSGSGCSPAGGCWMCARAGWIWCKRSRTCSRSPWAELVAARAGA